MFIETAQAGGVIDDAPTFAHVLSNTSDFLLQAAFIVGLIGFVAAGILYFLSGGDRRQIETAKKVSIACVFGLVVLLGAMVLIRTIGSFFS